MRFPPSSIDVRVSLAQSTAPSSILEILFWTRYRILTREREGKFGILRMLLKDRSSDLPLAML